jgi:hypothetical protein
MNYNELTKSEKTIVDRFRSMKHQERLVIASSQDSFRNWLQNSLGSIWNEISSFFSDFWNWFRNSIEPRGKFHKIWVDHNFGSGSTKGMRIHIKFEVDNLKDVSCRVIAYFHFQSGIKLKSNENSSYRTSDNQVCVGSNFEPSYNESTYNDFPLFIPYSEFGISSTGIHELKFEVSLYVKKTNHFFAQSHWVYFDYYIH